MQRTRMAPSICRKAAEFLTPTDPETTENTPFRARSRRICAPKSVLLF